MKIGDRLDIYRATCPKCENYRETIFAGPELVCRDHEEHPLFEGRRPALENKAGTFETPAGPRR